MEVNIHELSKGEILALLLDFKAIVTSPDMGVNISMFLRDDLSLNLELLELALDYIVGVTNILFIYDIDSYYKLRGIELNAKSRNEENRFILGFCNAISNEHSERGPIIVAYHDKNNQ